MPVEIHKAKSLYIPPERLSKIKVKGGINPFGPALFQPDDSFQKEETGPLHFRFQHDLESLWWVVLWIILYRIGGGNALQLAWQIFTCSARPSGARVDFFTSTADDLTEYIHEDLKPLVPHVLSIRAILRLSYQDKEKTERLMDHKEYHDIYEQMWNRLALLIQEVVYINKVKYVSFQNPKPSQKQTTEPQEEQ